MKVILVRHCETDHNRVGRVQGQSDAPLNERGLAQAACLAQSLAGQSIQALYSSPLRRAVQTAEPIAAALGIEVRQSLSLMEIDAGEMDGLTGAEMRERFPAVMSAWLAGPDGSVRLPGGESLDAVQARAWSFVESLRDQDGVQTAVCVTHYFVLLALIARAVRLPLSNISRLRQSLGSFSVVEFRNERVQVSKLNETCHLVDV
ncbi:MAG TPA: histidine phosphatase family protein [Dehalococcoidia bacterium]|nr:histidine phosphatase family protein [Dehalococcoidia bacterium]